jgi:hypothetical protein
VLSMRNTGKVALGCVTPLDVGAPAAPLAYQRYTTFARVVPGNKLTLKIT